MFEIDDADYSDNDIVIDLWIIIMFKSKRTNTFVNASSKKIACSINFKYSFN